MVLSSPLDANDFATRRKHLLRQTADKLTGVAADHLLANHAADAAGMRAV